MLCTNPLHAWSPDSYCRDLISRFSCENDKLMPFDCRPYFSFNKIPPHLRQYYREIYLPCGHCTACRISRSRDWVVRNCLELSASDYNSFLTLTYAEENLPVFDSRPTLVRRHLSDFLKLFRQRLTRDAEKLKLLPPTVRFFSCGEYGKNFSRPHYHLIIYGWDFPDREFFKNIDGNDYYTSKLLSDCWKFGFSLVSDVSSSAIRYVSGYVQKKKYGVDAEQYEGRLPEFVACSLKPGIGFKWFDKFGREIVRMNDHEILQSAVPSDDMSGLSPVPLAFKRRYAKFFPDLDEKRRLIIEHSLIPSPDWEHLAARRELLKVVEARWTTSQKEFSK